MRTGYGIKDIAEHGRICRKTSRQSVEMNKVLSSGSEVFLTAKLATDGVDFFTVPSGQCHVRSNTAFEMRIQRKQRSENQPFFF